MASHFNNGALECNCDMTGSLGYDCAKIGGQCPCKPNVIGRQCTRCKPGFFGYPECKQCNCPPTAQCNEDTGKFLNSTGDCFSRNVHCYWGIWLLSTANYRLASSISVKIGRGC